MITKKQNQKNIDLLQRLNFSLIVVSSMCVFAYFILLGLTSVNIVSVKSLTKNVDDKKTQLATVEFDYMSSQNIIALENASNSDFANAKNIAYVNSSFVEPVDTVAFAFVKK